MISNILVGIEDKKEVELITNIINNKFKNIPNIEMIISRKIKVYKDIMKIKLDLNFPDLRFLGNYSVLLGIIATIFFKNIFIFYSSTLIFLIFYIPYIFIKPKILFLFIKKGYKKNGLKSKLKYLGGNNGN